MNSLSLDSTFDEDDFLATLAEIDLPQIDFGSSVLRDAAPVNPAPSVSAIADIAEGCVQTKNLFTAISSDLHENSVPLCDELLASIGSTPTPTFAAPAPPKRKRKAVFPPVQIEVCVPKKMKTEEEDDSPPKKRSAPPRQQGGIRGNVAMRTSHTVNDLIPRGEAMVCEPGAENSQGCGQLYFMKSRTTGDWSHTLCKRVVGIDGSMKYVACNHYSFCMLCDPNNVDRHCKPFWNRSKFYAHRDRKHAHLVYADGWKDDPLSKDGGLSARINDVAKNKLRYYRQDE